MAKFYYGGQAVMEGVMMRGRASAAVAIRKPDQRIYLYEEALNPRLYQNRLFRLPFLRGLLLLWEMLVLGTRLMTMSANIATGAVDPAAPRLSLLDWSYSRYPARLWLPRRGTQSYQRYGAGRPPGHSSCPPRLTRPYPLWHWFPSHRDGRLDLYLCFRRHAFAAAQSPLAHRPGAGRSRYLLRTDAPGRRQLSISYSQMAPRPWTCLTGFDDPRA